MTVLEIEPHGGVGPLRLGAPRTEAHFALAPELPTSLATDPSGPAAEAWHDFALQAFFDEDDRIEYVEVERDDALRPLLFGAPVLLLAADDAIAHIAAHAPDGQVGPELRQGLLVPSLDLLLWRHGPAEDDGRFAGIGVGRPGALLRRIEGGSP